MIVALYGILDAITYIIDNHCRNPSVGFDSRSESMSGNCRRGYGSSVMASLKASVAAISAKHFSFQVIAGAILGTVTATIAHVISEY